MQEAIIDKVYTVEGIHYYVKMSILANLVNNEYAIYHIMRALNMRPIDLVNIMKFDFNVKFEDCCEAYNKKIYFNSLEEASKVADWINSQLIINKLTEAK